MAKAKATKRPKVSAAPKKKTAGNAKASLKRKVATRSTGMHLSIKGPIATKLAEKFNGKRNAKASAMKAVENLLNG